MDIRIHPEARYDVLVAGAGLAGIRAAISCAQEGMRVLLATPSRLCSGSSFYPLMDTIHCLCTSGPGDRERFMKDIRDCSWSMNDPWMSRYYVEHIEECLRRMPDTGILCRRLPEKKLACFGHTERDLYYWKGWDSLRESVRQIMERQPLITTAEGSSLVQVLTESGRVNGAVLLGPEGPAALSFTAVILASGGMGNLYLHSLNTGDITGSAHAAAMKAGARLINLEFNQFIPGFLSPAYKTVFREGSLRYCTGLLDPDGRDVLQQLLPDQRDYEECLMLREPHGPFTTADASKYFDIALMKSALRNIDAHHGRIEPSVGCVIRYSPDILKDERGYVRDYTDWLLREHGIHIDRDPISIAPFFHAANGGIQVDHSCSTTVPGLYACGEAAGGIHGADRLGGMASGSCLVFGALAARSACAYVREISASCRPPVTGSQARAQMKAAYTSCPPVTQGRRTDRPADTAARAEDTGAYPPEHPDTYPAGTPGAHPFQDPAAYICRRVRELMWQHAGIIRSQESLTAALAEADALGVLADSRCPLDSCFDVPQLHASIRAHQYADLSRALLLAMLERKESRGSHYREDAPEPDDASSLHRISIGLEENRYRVQLLPLPVEHE